MCMYITAGEWWWSYANLFLAPGTGFFPSKLHTNLILGLAIVTQPLASEHLELIQDEVGTVREEVQPPVPGAGSRVR